MESNNISPEMRSKITALSNISLFAKEILLVTVLLFIFFITATSSIKEKSTTSDEMPHLTGGYSYYVTKDYRLNAEAGILSQLIAALPLFYEGYNFPGIDAPEWQEANVGIMAYKFFYMSGNNPDNMLKSGRRVMIVNSLLLGLMIYLISRDLFSKIGAAISLALFVFCPNMLAHGGLITTDVTHAALFTLTAWCYWKLLHRVTLLSIIIFPVAAALLFLSKASGVLFLPLLVIMLLIRFVVGKPLEFPLKKIIFVKKSEIALTLFLVSFIHLFIVWGVIWAFYRFEFSSSAINAMRFNWVDITRNENIVSSVIQLFRNWKLLPEPFLYGFAFLNAIAKERPAFLNGNFSLTGWWYYFPYSFLIKTPVATLGILFLSLAALTHKAFSNHYNKRTVWIKEKLYTATPLILLLILYFTFALTLKVNIGLRYLFPVYPSMFILCGSAGYWLKRAGILKKSLVPIFLICVMAESLSVWPHYLAFFNILVGGPKNGYKHLVDSSLDWGQDLIGLKKWLTKEKSHNKLNEPVYLAYYGAGSPEYYQTGTIRIPGFEWVEYKYKERIELKAGTYCISATVLANILNDYPKVRGPWKREFETLFSKTDWSDVKLYENASKDPQTIEELVNKKGETYWQKKLTIYDMLRFSRLYAYLRERKPDANIGYSILIFKLTDKDLYDALYGPLKVLSP